MPTIQKPDAVLRACDCLNFCGDDPSLEKGKSSPCALRVLALRKMADKATALLESRHPDNVAVDRFAIAMKAKLASARAKGRSGWDDPAQCTDEYLSKLLRMSLQKGDPVDLANYAMMLHQRGCDIVRPSLTKYIDAINAAPKDAQAVVVDGQAVFINCGTSEQDWIDMAAHEHQDDADETLPCDICGNQIDPDTAHHFSGLLHGVFSRHIHLCDVHAKGLPTVVIDANGCAVHPYPTGLGENK